MNPSTSVAVATPEPVPERAEFSVQRSALLRLATAAALCSDRKSYMPVLACMCVTADAAITVTCTDLFRTFKGRTSGWTSTPGSIVVDAKAFVALLKTLPDGVVRITRTGPTAMLEVAGRRCTIDSRNVADYPTETARIDGVCPTVELRTKDLHGLLDGVIASVSKDETRPHVNAVLLDVYEEGLRAVATDGHRLALRELSVAHGCAPMGILLARDAALTVLKLTKGKGVPSHVTMRWQDRNLAFHIGDDTFTAKTVDAAFPPYEQIIPARSERVLRIDRQRFIDALTSVAPACCERTGCVRLEATATALRVKATSAEMSAEDSVPVARMFEQPDACTLEPIGANVRYLLDALEALPGEMVTLGIGDPLFPIVFRADGCTDIHICMPMRI